MKRRHLLALLTTALLVAALVAPAWGAPGASSGTPVVLAASAAPSLFVAQEKEKEKKKKKRGKVVKATLVTEPAEKGEAEPEEEVAESEEASAEDASTEEAEAEMTRAERKAEKEAEREARNAEKQAEQADRRAAKAAEQAERDRDREEARREAEERSAAERAERERQAARRQAESASPVATAAPTPTTPSPASASEPTAERAPSRIPTPSASPTPAPAPTSAAPSPTPPSVAADVPARADRPSQQPQDTFSERIQVREVLLDVLVTDRRGNPVVGLGPDDFVVIEDGEEREVTGVTYYGGVSELSGSGIEGETRTDRYFILFFHDQKQAAPFLTAAQLETGRYTKKWVDQLLPNDQVAVMGYDVRLKLYQDFTRDKAAILSAIDDASLGKKEPDRWKTVSDPEFDRDSPSLAVNLPTGKALARQTRKLQQALELVGEAAEGIVGRKNLILFSVGFGDIDGFGLYTPDPRYYPPMKQALNNGNVAVYAVDTVGSRRGSPGARDINDSLSAIATDTDGHYYSTFINALTPLEQVAEDNIGYYLVSYRAEYETGTSGYREVEVETKDDGFRVRSRKGYKYGSDS